MMRELEFKILEQYDGRYILVLMPFDTGMGWDVKGETLLGFEGDIRSTNRCYMEVAEFMISSGHYLDCAARIMHIQFPSR